MGLAKYSIIRNPFFRGTFIFLIGLSVEILQYFEINIFGNTANVFDILAYVSGIMMAVILEHFVLSKMPSHFR